MAMEDDLVQLLGHDHPLMLIKAEEIDDSCDLSCYGCEQPISGLSSYYGCKRCVFFLHKICAKLPLEMTHPSHPQHSLTLLASPTSAHVCDVCNEDCNRFVYRCHDCDYNIDMRCALVVLNIQQSIKHTSHAHQLTPVQKESMVLCEACGIKHEGASFLCTTCTLNEETENRSHDLGLNSINLSSSNAIPDADLYRGIHLLPVPYDPADIITQFIKSIAMQGKHGDATEIKHGNHDHPLTLYEKPIDHALSLSDGATNDEKCIGCTLSISAPFYHCLECKFFLHVWCAELPEELRHPAHLEHTLFLTKSNAFRACRCCNLVGDVLFYSCEECNFFLDFKCASLPRVIKHESHDRHPLALRPTTFSGTCISCSASSRISYECWYCKFTLCGRCATNLPCTVCHNFDKHPLTLTYSRPPYTKDGDFFCEICEEFMHPGSWFYHCGKCNQYHHTDCIFPVDKCSK